MEDIIGLIRFMGITKQSLKVACVPVFNLSGPTSGRVLEEELEEWARQARRWTIGAGEVFHYFLIKSTGWQIRLKTEKWHMFLLAPEICPTYWKRELL